MRIERSVDVDRPIDEVFEYTNKNVAEWSLTVVENEVLEEQPAGVGTRFRCVTEDHGRRMEFAGVVTRYEPPNVSVIRLEGKQFDLDVEYLFDALGPARTRVTQRSAVAGKGFTKIMIVLFGWLANKSSCRALDAELASLKAKLEDRSGNESER